MVGYARTALIRSALPPGLSGAEQRQARLDYYRYVAAGSGPKIVGHPGRRFADRLRLLLGRGADRDPQGPRLPGLVTDGGVRDLDAIAPDFQVLCGKVTPSHAWVHSIAFGGTVDVFGMVVRSDDLIHADRHGAVVIPHEVAREVADAGRALRPARGADPQGRAQPRLLARGARARHGRGRGDPLGRDGVRRPGVRSKP